MLAHYATRLWSIFDKCTSSRSSEAPTADVALPGGGMASRGMGYIGLSAVIALLVVPLAASASSSKRTFRAVKLTGGVATFKIRWLEPDQVRAARVLWSGVSRPVPLSRVRAAVRNGTLRTRIPGTRRSKRASSAAARATRPLLIVSAGPLVRIRQGPPRHTLDDAGPDFGAKGATVPHALWMAEVVSNVRLRRHTTASRPAYTPSR